MQSRDDQSRATGDMSAAPAGLKLFIAIWNRLQNQTTPHVHFRIADWLETAGLQNDTRLLLQAFRSCGKSTVVGLYAAWLLYRDPDTRILVLAAETSLARRMVRNVKRILERHPLTMHLLPDEKDQWASDRFTVRRHKELRDASMMARGIGANLTGSRADVIICDDVEVPATCDTAQKREALRELLSETGYVLVPGGTQLYAGTPHSWYSIYADAPRAEIGETRPFLADYSRLTLPLVSASGESAWPERFPPAVIEALRRRHGPNKFSSQMMLIPINVANGYLDPARLVFYGDIFTHNPVSGTYHLGERTLAGSSAYWDPSFGNGKGDHSVLAVVFSDAEGTYMLHRLAYIRNDPASREDEATQQCRQAAAIARELCLPSLTVEINGIGRFLPAILRRELAAARTGCAVIEKTNTRPKDTRILEAFDAPMAARALYIHESVRHTPFLAEMQSWRPGGGASGHDDGLDAVAGALSLQPLRLRRYYPEGRPSWPSSWPSGRPGYTARSEFDL